MDKKKVSGKELAKNNLHLYDFKTKVLKLDAFNEREDKE